MTRQIKVIMLALTMGSYSASCCEDSVEGEKEGDDKYVKLATIVGNQELLIESRRAALSALVNRVQEGHTRLDVLRLCQKAFSQAELSVIGPTSPFAGQWPFENENPLDHSLIGFVFRWKGVDHVSVVYFLIEDGLHVSDVKEIIEDVKKPIEDKVKDMRIKKVAFFDGKKEEE